MYFVGGAFTELRSPGLPLITYVNLGIVFNAYGQTQELVSWFLDYPIYDLSRECLLVFEMLRRYSIPDRKSCRESHVANRCV